MELKVVASKGVQEGAGFFILFFWFDHVRHETMCITSISMTMTMTIGFKVDHSYAFPEIKKQNELFIVSTE